jgi:hypothetical protein
MNGAHRLDGSSPAVSAAAPAPARGDARIGWLAAAIVPSIAAATTLASALWLSAAVFVSALATAVLAALLIRRPVVGTLAVLVLLAVLAGAADRAAAAWLPSLYADVGIALPITVVLLPGALAAATLGDGRGQRRIRRALARALAAALAFLGSVCLIALGREALGAGTITIPGLSADRVFELRGVAEAPARGLLLPLGGLIASGYFAGLAVLVVRTVERGRARRASPPAPARTETPAPPPAPPHGAASETEGRP